jgi:glycosyltransferase involved in cell wall biosynthesis
MNIGIPVQSEQKIGGGWSFVSNFTKAVHRLGYAVTSVDEADVVLIPSPTLCERDTFDRLQRDGKKIVLRLDNIVRNTRNRGTGMTRMKEFAEKADVCVFQSEWARLLLASELNGFLKPKRLEIINNAVDEEIFCTEGPKLDFSVKGYPIYLYSRYNKDETKEWIRAYYQYQTIQRKNKHAFLVLVGRFSDDLREYNFDFFNNERFEYIGIADTPQRMAQVYRGCKYLMATYYNDAFSNTYIEALMCGMELLHPDLSGGTKELLYNWRQYGREYYSLNRMAQEYVSLFRSL